MRREPLTGVPAAPKRSRCGRHAPTEGSSVPGFKSKMEATREKCVELVRARGPKTVPELCALLGERHASTVSCALVLCKQLRRVRCAAGERAQWRYELIA